MLRPAFPTLERWLDRPRNAHLALLLLGLLAFGVRLAHVLASRASPLFDSPQMDALFHVEWARAIASGSEFRDGPYFRAPLYPWFLGVVFALFGEGLLLPRVLQAGMGAASCLLTYRLGRELFGGSSGLLAGVLLAVYWPAVFYDGELLLEVLAVPLYLGGLTATLAHLRSGRTSRALAAGALFGLSAVCRPNVLLFLPPLAVYLGLSRRARGRSWRAAALFSLGVLLPIAPVTAVNALEGDRVLVSYQAGVNLWIGNHPGADGSTAIAPGTRADWWGGFEDTHAQAEAAEGRDLRPSEISRHYVVRTAEAIRADPGRWARLMLFKLRLFLMDWELGNNEEPRFLVERYSPWLAALPLSFGLLLGLASAGLCTLSRSRGPHVPPLAFAAIYALSVVLFFVNARFRLPVVPILAVYGAQGALACVADLRGRRLARAGLLSSWVLGVAVVSRMLVPGDVPRNSTSNGWLILGQTALRDGDLDQASSHLDRALDLWSESPVALEAIAATGHALFRAERFGEAAAAFARARRGRPRDFDLLYSQASSELAAGHPDRALPLFQRALEVPEPEPGPEAERFLYEAFGRAITLLEAREAPRRALELANRMVTRFPNDATARAVRARLAGE